MTRTATAIPTDPNAPAGARIPYAWHGLAAAWVCGMLAFAHFAPVRYESALQEDRFIEWWTVTLFAAAAWYRLRSALPRRALFDALVGLFCVFVAGEEFSWGQRLLGFTPPEVFLQNNYQQEFTVHNFTCVFGRPKGVLILALAGYALLAPLAFLPRLRPLLQRVGVSLPPLAGALWLVVAAALLVWYPADYTGEWVEALAGGIFLLTAPLPRRRLLPVSMLTAALALGLTGYSGWGGRTDPERLACAEREVRALVMDLENGAATDALLHRGGVHKRLYTSILDGYVDPGLLVQFQAVTCAENAGRRRLHGIDPWGTAYWIATDRIGRGERALTIYSMGPNRRRDERAGRPAPDDVAAFGSLHF